MYKDQVGIGDTCGVFVDGKIQLGTLVRRIDGITSVVKLHGKSKEVKVNARKLRRVKTGV